MIIKKKELEMGITTNSVCLNEKKRSVGDIFYDAPCGWCGDGYLGYIAEEKLSESGKLRLADRANTVMKIEGDEVELLPVRYDETVVKSLICDCGKTIELQKKNIEVVKGDDLDMKAFALYVRDCDCGKIYGCNLSGDLLPEEEIAFLLLVDAIRMDRWRGEVEYKMTVDDYSNYSPEYFEKKCEGRMLQCYRKSKGFINVVPENGYTSGTINEKGIEILNKYL